MAASGKKSKSYKKSKIYKTLKPYKKPIIKMLIGLLIALSFLCLRLMGNINGDTFWDGAWISLIFFALSVKDFLNVYKARKKREEKKHASDPEYKKNRESFWDIFDIDKYPESYQGPMIKIFLCIVVSIILLVVRTNVDETMDIILGIGNVICLYFFVITFPQILCVKEYREKAKKKWKKKCRKSKKYSTQQVVSLVKEKDAVKIEIGFNGKCIYLGAKTAFCSVHKESFTKSFFLDKETFATAEDFQKALHAYADENGDILLFTIDGAVPAAIEK